ncbi:hypothetical protein [Streptomyces sp. NPDC047000]|uniref:hypothetical protein n=1 Tax=Streptomyces sp. NPDC047000 TaxID=3155474 RepID=UPI0033D3F48D
MTAGAGADIHVVRGEGGAVRVTAGPAFGHGRAYDDMTTAGADFTRSVLDVAGAVLFWPVLEGPVLPVAEIHDVVRAQQWLWAVYGERVAVAVHTVAAEAQDSLPVRRPTGRPTALANAAARLSFGHWAARWWPASYTDGIPALEPDVLGLELAALTHQCQQLFDGSDDIDDQPDDCVAELVGEHSGALEPLIQWWRAQPQPSDTAQRLGSVLRLIDDAAGCAGLDGPALRRLRSASDQEQNRSGTGPAAGTPVDPGALFARQGGYALAAGDPPVAGGRVIARGSGTNDWSRYPPGFVDAAEDAVSWTVRALGARRQIEVGAVAHVAAPADAGIPLVAEVKVNGRRPNRVALARRDDVWTGRGRLDPASATDLSATAPPRIEVGVLLPGFDPGPGAGGRVDRDAIRALARRRLADAAQPPLYDVYDMCSGPFLAEILAAAATSEDY